MTSSEQARADALADAETLRLVVWNLDSRAKNSMLGVAFSHARYLYAADAAYVIGASTWPPLIAELAKQSAHAAFCAVPALRGNR